MDTLFKTMPELQEFVTVDISGNFKTISPYLVEAHKWLRKGIDKTTLNALIEYYNDSEHTPNEDYDNLLAYAQRVLANFAYALSAKRLGIFIGENGMMEYGNTTLTPLSTDKLDAYQKEFFTSGYNALEELILFIQENSTVYADAFSFLFSNTFFVRTAEEFNDLIKTDILNRDYFDMKSSIYLIEQDIDGIITAATSAELKAVIDSGATEDQQTMLSLIRPAEALIAYGEKFKSPKHELKGKQLLEQLRVFYNTLTEVTPDEWTNEDKRIYVFM
jgi:hypothetical protein